MKNNFNVVGDVAGNFLTLQALLAQMPKDAELICLGDPVDRGPRSKQVVEFLMNNGRTLNSNHAHMMVTEWYQHHLPGSYPRYYDRGIWPQDNGGMATVFSYGADENWMGKLDRLIPAEHIKFLENCPMYIESDDFVMTHAPARQYGTLEEMSELGKGFTRFKFDYVSDFNLLWNRYVPARPNPELKGKINIFGHNASDDVKVYTTQYPQGIKVFNTEGLKTILDDKEKHEVYAIVIDTSKPDYAGNQKLTGLHLPTMTLYFQEYID